MDRAKSKLQCQYKDKLDPGPRKRYAEKIKIIGDLDPYEHKQWSGDLDALPPFTEAELVLYLVSGISYYTSDEFRSTKSLLAHGQTNFGWVQDLRIFQTIRKNYTVVISEVLHSQRLREAPLEPWVILHSSGKVETAHCTCMAGVAESCTHVAALLFKIEAAVKIRGSRTCTDVAAYWMLPANLNKVEAAATHQIDYSTAATKKKEFDKFVNGEGGVPGMRTRVGDTCPLADAPAHTDEAKALLFKAVHSRSGVCCSGSSEYYGHYADPVKPSIMPKSLQLLRDQSKDGCELSVLQHYCGGLRHVVAVSEREAALVEKKTRQQHKSNRWYALRAGRITASKMHAVVSTSVAKPAISTVKAVCYPKKTNTDSTVQHVKWGLENEENARRTFITMTAPKHDNLTVERCGFVINPSYPEVGASPDGLTHCTCCGKGCLEVKCPSKHRYNTILQACEDKNFCLLIKEGKFYLKKTHSFYSQAQTQMFVTGSNFCDFVVWTTNDCEVLRVMPDVDFWKTVLAKAQDFFYKVTLPELVACHFTRGVSQDPHLLPNSKRRRKKTTKDRWCTCGGPEEMDDMVACDSENCKIVWFHLTCVGLTHSTASGELWFCNTCQKNTHHTHPPRKPKGGK